MKVVESERAPSLSDMKEMKDVGELSLGHVVALPRSVSTAYMYGLATSLGAEHLHEPLNKYNNREISAANLAIAGLISASEGETRIIMKNINQDVAPVNTVMIATIARGTLLMVRDPRLQVASLFDAKTRHFQHNAHMSASQAREAATIALTKNNRITRYWVNMHDQVIAMDAHDDLPSLIIDGSDYLDNPADIILESANFLGMDVHGPIGAWSEPMGNDFVDLSGHDNVQQWQDGISFTWLDDALSSTAVHSERRDPDAYTELPDSLVVTIEGQALDTYHKILEYK